MRKRFDLVGLAILLTTALLPATAARAETVNTILLLHGAFADGSSWDAVVPLLQSKGFKVVAVQLPLTGLAEDVAATKRAIDAQQGAVLLVGHSYAGVVITEAGNSDKVAGLVYVAAFAPGDKESVNDLGKGKPAPAWAPKLQVDSGGYAWLTPELVATSFAPDVLPPVQNLIGVKQKPILLKSFDAKVTKAAWKTKPSWYVRAEQDKMIDPAAQAAMAKRINATTTNIMTSHVPMLAKPNDVAAVILTAAQSKPAPAKPAPASAPAKK
ncbi:MAG TPA: alpha/beta hydrolase [Kofleriaceae bacterium]|nr:alpha/beta hydrolase [Kofleriaceae bacterium]